MKGDLIEAFHSDFQTDLRERGVDTAAIKYDSKINDYFAEHLQNTIIQVNKTFGRFLNTLFQDYSDEQRAKFNEQYDELLTSLSKEIQDRITHSAVITSQLSAAKVLNHLRYDPDTVNATLIENVEFVEAQVDSLQQTKEGLISKILSELLGHDADELLSYLSCDDDDDDETPFDESDETPLVEVGDPDIEPGGADCDTTCGCPD